MIQLLEGKPRCWSDESGFMGYLLAGKSPMVTCACSGRERFIAHFNEW